MFDRVKGGDFVFGLCHLANVTSRTMKESQNKTGCDMREHWDRLGLPKKKTKKRDSCDCVWLLFGVSSVVLGEVCSLCLPLSAKTTLQN